MSASNGTEDRSNGHGRKEQITEMQQIVEASMPDSSKKEVYQILEKIEELKPAEKLLLYLRLPTGAPDTDPLKQPQNPLGTRLEINHTINWVRSHLEIDPNVSIPKQDVYDDYFEYCNKVDIKPLSTADFGKVMKQVFPSIRPRRLGTRGNSRYCYAALRKTTQLAPPSLPELKLYTETDNTDDTEDDQVSTFVKTTIKTWASNLLNLKFERMEDLASYITTNNMNSLSAKVLQRKITRDARLSLKKNETLSSKRRRRKRRITSQSLITEAATSTSTSGNVEIVEKFAKKAPIEPILLSNIKTEIDVDNRVLDTNTTLNETKVYCDKNFDTDAPQYPSLVSNIEKEPVKNVITTTQNAAMKPPYDRPRIPLGGAVNGMNAIDSNVSLKRLLNTSTTPPTRPNFVFREPNNIEAQQQQQVQQSVQNTDETSDLIIPRERVISICTLDKDALDSYLVEGENSQDQEAELMEYFQGDVANVPPV
ncbi:DNA-binding protein RFX7, partial [Pseudolycoriella hygida]